MSCATYEQRMQVRKILNKFDDDESWRIMTYEEAKKLEFILASVHETTMKRFSSAISNRLAVAGGG